MTAQSTLPLLVELGCEEIPARFLAQAQKDLGDRLKAALEESRLLASPSVGAVHEPPLQTFSTPRRLVAHAPAILERQPDKTEEITGPPVKVAVDAQGKYTRAAESFAQKNSADVKDLIRITTPKGEHLAVKKTTQGRPALDVLAEILPGVITGLNFPKSMYWTGKSGPRFVRPIRWILALLGEGKHAGVIPFEIAGVKAGDFTFGHRTVGQDPVRVSSFKEYVQKLNQSQVKLEPENRRERVRSECKALLEGSGLRVVEDKTLEDWMVNSTEWPCALQGNFEEKFLKLPREILVTVMRDHQKYFAVEDTEGVLRPSFVTLLNVAGDPKGLIRRGHERVLTARFSDAEFFWKADQKIPLEQRRGMLEKVTYQAKLGTYAQKVARTIKVAPQICRELHKDMGFTAEHEHSVVRALQLMKCDLTTQMVQEFTELQGIVGGLYARRQDEPLEIAEAIYDHYLPHGIDDQCPKSLIGALVSLLDKLDGVIAGYAAGLAPTGSNDPFGVRRQGNGVIKLLIEFNIPVRLSQLVSWGIDALNEQQASLESSNLRPEILDFFEERLRFYLESKNLPYDTVRAVVAADRDSPHDALQRALAVQEMRGSEDFIAVCAAAKRIRNILAKSASDFNWQAGDEVNEALLVEDAEKELHRGYIELRDFHLRFDDPQRYQKFLRKVAGLRPVVDLFFDKVMVMAEDITIRQNRLRILGALNQRLSVFAHLSEIEQPAQIESSTSTSVDASTGRKTVARGE